jgi:hypothetical protein
MKKKRLVFFIILLCLGLFTICYFFYKPTLKPSICFSKKDKEVLIVTNRKIEIDSILTGPSSNFFQDIKDVLPFKKVYISLTKSKLLFQFNEELSSDKIEKFFNEISLKFVKNRYEFKLSNKWNCIFYDNYLFFYKGRLKTENSNLHFTFTNADFSIFNCEKNVSQDYFKTIRGLLKVYKNTSNIKFINKFDFKQYSKFLPEGIEDYHFYEKKYAIYNALIEKNSSFEKLIKNGFCVFKLNGNEFILVDILNNKDPYVYFDEEIGRKEIVSGLRKKYEQIYLTSKTRNLNESFYIDYIGDKLLFSKSSSDHKEVLAAFNENKTIYHLSSEREFVFKHQPSSVIYRGCTKDQKITITAKSNKFYEHRFISTISKKSIDYKTFDSVQDVIKIIGDKKNIFVFTKNQIFKISNDQIIQKVKYKGELIGDPELINYKGNELILFTSSKKLYLLNSDFDNVSEFPIILKNKPKFPFRFFQHLNKFIGYSEKNILSISDEKGNVQKKIEIDLKSVNPISFFYSRIGMLIIYNDDVAHIYNAESCSYINRIKLSYKKAVFFTTNQEQSFFYIEKDKLVRNDFNGDLKVCASGKKLSNLKFFQQSQVIGVLSSKNIALFNSNGECVSKIILPTNQKLDFTIVKNIDGESYVILINDLKNDIYIYTFDGELILKSPFKGDESFYVSKKGRNFELYTVYKNKLLKYFN